MTRSKYIFAILVLVALLAACGPVVEAGEGGSPLQAWIDAPLDGSVIPEETYTLVFSGASQDGSVDGFEIQVNGQPEGDVSPAYQSSQGANQYAYGEYEWLPPAPGTYLVEVRALGGEGASPYAQALVQVGGLLVDVAPPEEPEEEAAEEEQPPPDDGAPMFDTNMFYYGGSCTPSQVQTEIQVLDPEAFSIVMFYRLRGVDSELRTDWVAAAMNPGSEGYYRLIVPSSSIPDRDMFDAAYFQVQIVGTDANGDEILRTDVVANQVMLLACGEEPEEPTNTPVEEELPTDTPVPPTPTPIPPPA